MVHLDFKAYFWQMRKSPRYPDFIIGGAPKSGTSSLYFWLAAHPKVCGSRVKEPFFFGEKVSRFNEGCNYLENPIEDYSRYFEHCPDDKLAFEATAGYIYSENAIEGLQKLPTTPKVIFLLRNPAGQLLSHYKMERFRINNVDCSFEEYVKLPRAQKIWRYSTHLSKWLAGYDQSKMHFILFEDLVKNKKKVMGEVAQFLEIDPSFYEDFNFDHRNESRAMKSKSFHKWGLKLQRYIPHWLQSALLPIYLKVNSKPVPKTQDDFNLVLSQMNEQFTEEIEQMKALFPALSIEEYWKRS